MKKKIISIALSIVLSLSLFSCGQPASKVKDYGEFGANGRTPSWTKDLVMYEVNVRQYTSEGTFDAFREHLPELKEMGVTALWIMPIHPISETRRSGKLGSYYSITDYRDVNPEFGTHEDFKELVDAAHAEGMYVLMDWVANHTGWDSQWIKDHPDWYTQDADGNIISPLNMGWPDVADLNFDNRDMRKEMIECMKYWITEFDVDGFRCDYASGVPVDFWDEARAELQQVKPVFMLAEDGSSDSLLVNAFDMNYGWSLYDNLLQVARGNKKAVTVKYYTGKELPSDGFTLNFLDNHDKNSYEHTIAEGFGYDAIPAMFALTYTIPGAPLIYSGDEVGLNQVILFTSKSTIRWNQQKHDYREYLRALADIRKENEALFTGSFGGEIVFEKTEDEHVLCYHRDTEDNSILCVLNLSDREASVDLTGLTDKKDKVLLRGYGENERDLTEKKIDAELLGEVTLKPWEYIIIER